MKRLLLTVAGVGLTTTLVFAQNQTVRGVITDAATGEAIIGANVVVKGHTTVGAATDLDGKFSLNAPKGATTLVITYVGYKTTEVAIKPNMTIKLAADNATLDDVVVVAYGTVKKQSLVGAQSSLGNKDLAKRPLSNVSNALAGAAPGIQTITSTGQPGASADIRIRGFGSVNASSAPLYVVDGSIYSGNISDIPTQDIQSISILKDAASTALYGSSAGNGVILITTRSGSRAAEGKPSFTFTMNQGFSRRGQEDYEKIGAMQHYTTRWQQWFNQQKYSNGLADDEAGKLAAYYVWNDLKYNPYKGLESVYEEDASTKEISLTKSPKSGNFTYPAIVLPDGTLNPEITGLAYCDDLDWESPLFQTGVRSEYTFSGGLNTKNMQSFISFGYLNEKGYRIETGMERFNGRANLSYDLNKWLSVGTNIGYTRTKTTAPRMASGDYSSNSFGFVRSIAPIYPVHLHNEDGSYVTDVNGNYVYDHTTDRPYAGRFNPVEESYLDLSTGERDALTSRTFAKFNLYKGLTFTTNVSYDLLNSRSKVRYNNSMGDQPQGKLTISQNRYTTVTWNQLLDYKLALGKNNFDFLLGHESYKFRSQGLSAEKSNAFLAGLDEFGNYTKIEEANSFTTNYRKESYFGRINYDHDGKYNASFSFRRDGSSRFATDKRWGNFWSVGAGWNIHQERFMKSIGWLSELKLRASIGQTGNDGLDSYFPYQTLYGLGNNNASSIGLRISNLGNPDLIWETQTSTDLALEFGLFKNRIKGTIEYFNKESKDLIFDEPLPASTGIASISRNIGKVRNYGLEFSLEGAVIQTRDWRWALKVNGTITKNKIVSLPKANRESGIELTYHKYVEGGGMYDYYIKEFIKVDPQDGVAIYRLDTDKYPTATPLGTTGEEATWTKNGDQAKRHFAGTSIPDLYGGFGTDLSWKDFDLGVMFAYQLGGKTYDGAYASLMGRSIGSGSAMHVDLLNAWRKPGDVTDVPRLDAGNAGQYATERSDRFLISSSSLMLKSISLGYNLPKSLTSKLNVSNIRVGVSAENLFLLSARKGLNPMGQYSGVIGAAYYDYAKTVSANLSITF